MGGRYTGWHRLMASVPSLQQPFQGEYLGLTQNPKYQKLHAVAKDKLVMADTVRKVNRASGKVSPPPAPAPRHPIPTAAGRACGAALTPPCPQTVPRLLLLTTEHLVLADPKAAQPKTVLSLSDIRSVSVTRFSDGFLALHLKEVPGAGGGWGGLRGVPGGADPPPLSPQTSTGGAKGDFLLVSDHLIELVTRLHQTLMDTTAQALPLHITDQYGQGRGGAGPTRVGPVGWGSWGRASRGGELLIGCGRAALPGGGREGGS